MIFSYIEIFYFFIGVSSAAIGNYFTTIKFFIVAFVFLYSSRYYSASQKQILVYSILFIFVCNLAYNILLYFLLPNYLNYTGREARQTGGSIPNVFSTAYSTATLLFSGVFFVGFLNTTRTHRTLRLIFLLSFLLSSFYVAVCSERATNFILLLIMIVLILAVKLLKIENRQKFILFTLLIIILVPVFLVYAAVPLITHFSDLLSSERIRIRLLSIVEVLNGASLNDSLRGTLDIRYQLAITSLRTFTSSVWSVLFGKGYHVYGSVSEAFELGIGGHSQLIDILAKYGLLGATIVFIFLLNLFLGIRKTMNVKWAFIFDVIFFVFLLRSFLGNTFEPMIAIPIIVFYPLVQEIVTIKERKIFQ